MKSLALIMLGLLCSSCISTNSQKGIQAIEQMEQAEFDNLKIYISLGIKIPAHRLLQSGSVSEQDLTIASAALKTIRDQSVIPTGESIIQNALLEAGLTNDEVLALFTILERELVKRGALQWTDTGTGFIVWSDRTKELLTAVIDALDAANVLTESELRDARELQVRMNGKMINDQDLL